jgi:hypothetical protein
MIPAGAQREAILHPGEVSVHDVSRILPRGPSGYRGRDENRVEAIVVHKSGADGPAGYAGCEASARFCVDHRRWPGAAYTYWIPREPDEDDDGCLVVYRCHSDVVVSYHTGGRMNRIGIGIGVQGRYDGEWDLVEPGRPKIEREPTKAQWQMLEALVDYLRERHHLWWDAESRESLTGHWEHGKPICPGDALRVWVCRRRGDPVVSGPTHPPERPEPTGRSEDLYRLSTRDLQRILAELGHDPGPVDGVLGYRTRAALERMQHEAGVVSDGWYGPETARALGSLLRKRGLR